ARPPVLECAFKSLVESAVENLDQFKQGKRVLDATPHVVSFPARNLNSVQRGRIRGDQVMDVENVSHLLAVTVNSYGPPRRGTDAKPCEPALILHPELPWPINAGLAKHQGSHAVNPRIIEHILVAGALGTSVRRIRVEWAIL